MVFTQGMTLTLTDLYADNAVNIPILNQPNTVLCMVVTMGASDEIQIKLDFQLAYLGDSIKGDNVTQYSSEVFQETYVYNTGELKLNEYHIVDSGNYRLPVPSASHENMLTASFKYATIAGATVKLYVAVDASKLARGF